MELKVVFTISIIINIACLVLNFLGEKSWGNEIFSIGMFFFLGYWIFYYLTRWKELKIENGNLYFDREDVLLKGYKVEYSYGNKIYLKTQNESFLFLLIRECFLQNMKEFIYGKK